MARVKLRCIMGCPGLKSSYREKGLLGKHEISKTDRDCRSICSQVFYRIVVLKVKYYFCKIESPHSTILLK